MRLSYHLRRASPLECFKWQPQQIQHHPRQPLLQSPLLRLPQAPPLIQTLTLPADPSFTIPAISTVCILIAHLSGTHHTAQKDLPLCLNDYLPYASCSGTLGASGRVIDFVFIRIEEIKVVIANFVKVQVMEDVGGKVLISVVSYLNPHLPQPSPRHLKCLFSNLIIQPHFHRFLILICK